MSISKSIFISLSLTSALCLANVAVAVTLKVPGDYATIQDAIDELCDDGGTVKIGKGTFFEDIDIDGCTDLKLKGNGRNNTTIDSKDEDGDTIEIKGGSTNITIKRLSITGAGKNVNGVDCDDSTRDGIQVRDSNTITIKKNRIHGNCRNGVHLDGHTGGVVIHKNEIDDNSNDGVRSQNSGGAKITRNEIHDNDHGIDSESANLIADNKIYDNSENGINAGPADVIKRNTITSNGDDGIEVKGRGVIIVNNTVEANDDDGINVDAEGAFVASNTVKGNNKDGINGKQDGVFEKNKSTGNRDGFTDADENNVIQRNKFNKNERDGVKSVNDSDTWLFYKNRMIQNEDDGIDFDGGEEGNTYERNKAKENGDLDAENLTGVDNTNAFIKNKFGTSD